MRIILTLSVSFIFTFTSFSQVDTRFELDWKLFLSIDREHKSKDKWICGVDISALDTTNRQLNVRLDLLKNWEIQDSLDLIVTLDTTQIYPQLSGKRPFDAMKYVSPETGVVIFLSVPDKYEYVLSNGMSGVSYQFDNANVILPRKWNRHRKHFTIFYGK